MTQKSRNDRNTSNLCFYGFKKTRLMVMMKMMENQRMCRHMDSLTHTRPNVNVVMGAAGTCGPASLFLRCEATDECRWAVTYNVLTRSSLGCEKVFLRWKWGTRRGASVEQHCSCRSHQTTVHLSFLLKVVCSRNTLNACSPPGLWLQSYTLFTAERWVEMCDTQRSDLHQQHSLTLQYLYSINCFCRNSFSRSAI